MPENITTSPDRPGAPGADLAQPPESTDPRRYEFLTRLRLEDPQAVARVAAERPRHTGPRLGHQNFIVAADHPARGALSVRGRSTVMADRRELLDRLRIAMADPAVDGVLASPDVLDDLLLLGALDHKLIFGSMNRGGLSGLVNEIDDRFTGHSAKALKALGANGGKMLTRIHYGDPATVATLEATARAVDSLAEQELIAMIEPFISTTRDGRIVNDLRAESVAKSAAIAAGLGETSAYTWMKLPVVAEMEQVMAATTLPTVLLGGDPAEGPEEIFASWEKALTLPGVQGLTVGRTLLYPEDGDVAGAVSTAASLLRRPSR